MGAVTSDHLEELATVLPHRYRPVREIGRGSSASVYLAHDLEADRDVVVKILHGTAFSQIESQRFKRETRRLGQLLNPGLPALLDAGESNGRYFLVSPFVDGETRRQRLSRARQSTVAATIDIGRQIAGVLGYLDAEGVIHRDLKPENVYVTTRGHVLLLDLGLAKLMEATDSSEPSLTAAGASVGTPQYTASERNSIEPTLLVQSPLHTQHAHWGNDPRPGRTHHARSTHSCMLVF